MHKKTIGIDARLMHESGVGTYIRNLLTNLFAEENDHIRYIVYVLSSDAIPKVSYKADVVFKVAPYRWHTISEQTSFLLLLERDKPDLMHFTYFSYPILYRRPFVITMHDLIPLYFKTGEASTHNPFLYQIKYAGYRLAISRGIHTSKAIIVPTDSVATDIKKEFGESVATKIFTTYEGIDSVLAKTKPDAAHVNKYPGKFLIRVGNFYPHKNTERLIKAFLKSRIDYVLICVGPKDFFSQSVEKLILKLQAQDRIKIHLNASQEELAFFYKNATALVQPSLTEGFGLPILEAVYFDLPIIASDIPVFHELIGNHYYSFDPSDESSMVKALTEFDLDKQKKRISKDILKKFSFKRMSEETVDVYKKILDTRY